MCHNCLYFYCIQLCKGLLSQTEFAVKLEENISQEKVDALFFMSWFYFMEFLRSNSISSSP